MKTEAIIYIAQEDITKQLTKYIGQPYQIQYIDEKGVYTVPVSLTSERLERAAFDLSVSCIRINGTVDYFYYIN